MCRHGFLAREARYSGARPSVSKTSFKNETTTNNKQVPNAKADLQVILERPIDLPAHLN